MPAFFSTIISHDYYIPIYSHLFPNWDNAGTLSILLLLIISRLYLWHLIRHWRFEYLTNINVNKKFTLTAFLAILCYHFAISQNISGNVIYDPNNNTTSDGSDFGMPAVKIYLYEDKNNNNLIDANEKIDSTITDAYGFYSFGLKGTMRTFSINASADDANERASNGAMDINDDRIKIVRDGSNCTYAGLRFTNINMIADSVSFAQIRFYTRDDASGNGTLITINGQSANNASAFTTSSYNISNRAKTSKSQLWALTNLSKDNTYYTPDISAVLREIMTTNSWTSSNAVAFIFSDNSCTSSSPFMNFYSRDNSSSKQARLEVYSPTGKRYFVGIAPDELGSTASANVSSYTIAPNTSQFKADFYIKGKAPICYAVGDNGGSSNDDDLVAYNRNTGTSVIVKKNISTNKNIEAMALNKNSTKIYAMDGDVLASYDFQTGNETYRSSAIGNFNYRNAARTSTLVKDLSDPDGMTMDIDGNYWISEVSGTNILLKIDTFGNVFPNTFGTGIAGLEIVLNSTLTNAGSTKLDDLAFNPITGKLYASFTGGNTEYIVEIPTSGSNAGKAINPISFSTSNNVLWTDLEGLAMTNDGVLAGTTGKNANNSSQNNHALVFNQSTLKIESAYQISASYDFESCNCFTRNTDPMVGLTISGKLFDDANGLTDNVVNGVGIRNPNNIQFYAYLLDPMNNVVAATAINSDGSFSLTKAQENNAYEIKLSSEVFSVGSIFTGNTNLPTDWVATGENYGTNNEAGTGNETGSPNLSILVYTTSFNVTNVNFGINKRPTTDDYSFSIASPTINSVKSLTATNGLDTLSGADFEDGILGKNNKFKITSIAGLNGNTLFYDANNNGVVDAGETLTANSVINNYDPAKLKVRFNGLNSTSLTFNYTSVDVGSLEDLTPATYTITWVTPVPVVLIYFDAEKEGKTAKLTWSTASELNNSHFEIYRGVDTKNMIKIGEVKGFGTTQQVQQYEFNDLQPFKVNYYQLRQVDFDGQSELTQIKQVNFDEVVSSSVNYFPNPTSGKLNLNIQKLNKAESIDVMITDYLGRVVVENQTLRTSDIKLEHSVDLSLLPNGMYVIYVTIGSEKHTFNIKKI